MRLSILQRMLTFILLPAIIGLIAVTALNYNSANKALTNQINEELQLVLHGQKVELFNTVNLLASTMNNFALNADVIELLRAKANNTGNENKELEQKIKESILYLVKNYSLLRDVGLVDKNGTVLIHSTESFIGNSVAERAYFKAAMKGEVAPVTIQSRANCSCTLIKSLSVQRTQISHGSNICCPQPQDIMNLNKMMSKCRHILTVFL